MSVRLGAALLAAMIAVAGCGSGKTADDSGTSADISVSAEAALHDALPAALQKSGTLIMATDPTYPPNEFRKGIGYQGFDIDLANALGTLLGMRIEIRKAQFDAILIGINGGRYDFSMSSFTDNMDREKGNDFVTYFKAGTSIGVHKGNPKGVKKQLDLCGLKVGAEKGTIQADALTKDLADGAPTLKANCEKAKRADPVPVLLPDQAGVYSAVIAGRADAFTGDSPVVAYQAKTSGGDIEVAGATTDVAPYGIAFKKGSPLVPVFQKAMSQLIENGTYTKIIDTWGIQDGAVMESKVNDAG